jgi:hypothetical protein
MFNVFHKTDRWSVVKMTITPKKYTARRLITHHHIPKAQMIWATGFPCRAGQRKLCRRKIIIKKIMTNTEKTQPLKMVEFSIRIRIRK